MRFCTECGRPLKEDALFCHECGTPVKRPATDETTILVDSENQVPSENVETDVKPTTPETHEEDVNQAEYESDNLDIKADSSIFGEPEKDSPEDQPKTDHQPNVFDPQNMENEKTPTYETEVLTDPDSFNPIHTSDSQYQQPNQPFNQVPPSQPYNPNAYVNNQTTIGDSHMQQSRTERRQHQFGNETPIQGHAPTPQPRKPMSLKAKILLSVSVIAIILLVSAHFVLQYLHSPQRIVEDFEQALKDYDTKEITSLLHSNHKDLKIDKETVSGFVKYFEKNPKEINSLIKDLKEQATQLEKGSDVRETGMVWLAKDGKFLFYDQYKLMVPGTWLYLYTNSEDVTFSVNGKEIGTSDSEDYFGEFGPFLPGIHTVEAALKTDFVDETIKEEIFLDGVYSEYNLDMYFDLDYVEFYLPYEIDFEGPATLYINGKNTGVDLQEESVFGPIGLGSSPKYYVEATINGEKVKSEEMPIESYYNVVEFPEEILASNKSEEEIYLFMDSYFNAAVAAFNARDISISRDYFDPNGPALKEVEDYLEYIETTDFLEVFYWVEIVSVEKTDGGYNVTTNENYDIYKEEDFSGRNATFESKFYLTVVDGELKVHTLKETTEIETNEF